MAHLIIDNTFQSPYFIFIKCDKHNYDYVLTKLNLQNWEEVENKNLKETFDSDNRHFYTTWKDGWLHIMDDWYYTLWFDNDLKNRLKNLSNEFDIFSCSVGDSDSSFDFRLWKNAKLIREFVVEDPKHNGGKITKDLGVKLPGEVSSYKKHDAFDLVISIAKKQGISINHLLTDIKGFRSQEVETEKFIFNDNKF